MGKAAGLMAVVFMLGGGVMTVTSAALGHWAEAAALAAVGMGMFGTSQLLSPHPRPRTQPKTARSEAH